MKIHRYSPIEEQNKILVSQNEKLLREREEMINDIKIITSALRRLYEWPMDFNNDEADALFRIDRITGEV